MAGYHGSTSRDCRPWDQPPALSRNNEVVSPYTKYQLRQFTHKTRVRAEMTQVRSACGRLPETFALSEKCQTKANITPTKTLSYIGRLHTEGRSRKSTYKSPLFGTVQLTCTAPA